MNTDYINRAIQAERDAEARVKVAPIFKRMSRLVAKTKVDEAIVLRPSDDRLDTQFYGLLTDDSWHYGNGAERMSTDRLVDTLVRAVADGGKAYRLVKEKK